MKLPRSTRSRSNAGFALVAVLFVVAILFVLVGALLFQVSTERHVAANEQDHIKALGFAEAGLAWAERRINDGGDMSDLLDGPNDGSSTDDALFGLRDLSLTATDKFTKANEDTKSAIVSRDFDGRGSKNYEVVRLVEDATTRAHLYVRLDDNWDDDPDSPSSNDELTDTDNLVRVTVAAEYPVYVDGAGKELSNPVDRGRAIRVLRATFSGGADQLTAVATNGDIEIGSSTKVCGDCATVHSNADFSRNSGGRVCENATASGSFSGSCSNVGGDCGGGRAPVPVPVISPYDDLYVPTIDTFDTTGDSSLPARMRCPRASSSDPGANKYFALVADNSKGRVFKAYWDSTNARWEWKLIDNLDSGPHAELDDCGRVVTGSHTDPNFGNKVSDGGDDEFYGFKGDKMEWDSCSSCGSSGDDSMCTLGNNDFTANGYYSYPSGGLVTSYNLPGDFAPDSTYDIDPRKSPKAGGAKWDYSGSEVYSPLHGAVIFVYGTTMISGNPGDSSSIDFKCSGGPGCSSSTLPKGLWQLSLISLGDIQVSGQANLGPANPDQDYSFLFISGRDLMLNGNPQEDTTACGSNCSTTGTSDVKNLGGVYAVHEQIQISGNPNIFGFMLVEDAIDCSSTVDGKGSGQTTFNGDPQIFYDCQHPPNPWVTVTGVTQETWEEIE